MADISTGRQRGIVPFVDETTGRLPDQYLPQGVIDLEGDLEQAVTDASASATAAKASETAAKANATAADSSAQAAAASAESAQTATESATSSKDAAARSASEASESAQAAETSKTNAAASASAAKVSETNAAASATAAQQAVDGFGLGVGTTTTGEPGTDASVSITKQGTKYVADFTIPQGPNGPQGPQGPKGDPGDLTTVAHDTTLTGDGTSGAPLGAAVGSMLNPHGGAGVTNADAKNVGITRVGYSTTGLPSDIGENDRRGFLIGSFAGEDSAVFAQLLVNCPVGTSPRLFLRGFTSDSNPSDWTEFAAKEDIPNVSALTSRIDALEPKLNELAVTQTRLQALETRIKSLETN